MPGTRKTAFESLLEDADIVAEIQNRAAAGNLAAATKLGWSGEEVAEGLGEAAAGPGRTLTERVPLPPSPSGRQAGLEAIVLLDGRPSLLVRNGTFELPENGIWREALLLARSGIEGAIARTGRIDLFQHLDFEWVGTGWLVAPDIVVTNRHVAAEFAAAAGDGFAFATNLLGQTIAAQVDFRREHNVAAELAVRVTEVLHIAAPSEPDIALLRIASDRPLPEPLELDTTPPDRRAPIGVVGYPAFDPRNGKDAMADIFGGVFDVKRFAPGKVSHTAADEHWFVHDCSTLGGASGSPVFSLDTGAVVGLHFSGRFLDGNFAVKARHVADVLAGLTTTVPGAPAGQVEAIADGRHPPGHFDGRDGYRADFLDHPVAMPGLGAWADVITAPEGSGKTLDYRHFSVIMSAERNLPLLTAVNIDGGKARRIFRETDKWYVDERIPEAAQLGNEIYRSNDLDRGHMVRRLDPVWGSEAEAAEANDDTFHYVNAAPQHKDLNRRVWGELEDFLLDSAKAKDLRMSVFTGPVLRPDDRLYRDLVRLPREFWKVAVIVDRSTGLLSAAGYVLSQGDMIRDITEVPVIFGEHRTYQVRIEMIAQATGLDFTDLAAHDAMSATEEALHPVRAVEVSGPRDIRI